MTPISEFLAEQKRLAEDGRTVFNSDVLRMIAALEAVMEMSPRLPYNDDPSAWSPDPLDGYTAEEAYARGVIDAQSAIEAALGGDGE